MTSFLCICNDVAASRTHDPLQRFLLGQAGQTEPSQAARHHFRQVQLPIVTVAAESARHLTLHVFHDFATTKLSIYGSTTLVKSPLSNVNSVQPLRLFGEASRAGRRRLRRRCSSICAEPCVRAAAMAAESSFDFLDLNMLTTIAKTPGCLSGWPARQLEYQGPQCYWQRHLCHPGALWISSGQP